MENDLSGERTRANFSTPLLAVTKRSAKTEWRKDKAGRR